MTDNSSWRAIREEKEALRKAKAKPVNPGVIVAHVQAQRVRKAIVGRLCGQPGPEHRAGGER